MPGAPHAHVPDRHPDQAGIVEVDFNPRNGTGFKLASTAMVEDSPDSDLAVLIDNLRKDIPHLVAEIRRLRAENARLRG